MIPRKKSLLLSLETYTTTYSYVDAQAASRRVADGNLIASTDRDGRTRDFTCDNLNRETHEIWLDSSGNTIYTLTDSYVDALCAASRRVADGKLIAASDSNSTYQYTYNADNQLTNVDNQGTPGTPDVLLNYTYDVAGNRLSTTDTINGVVKDITTYSYDATGSTTEITQSSPGVQNERVDYTYDAASELISLNRYSDLAGTNLVAVTTYTYDAAGRLIGLNDSHNGISIDNYTYQYDADNRITQQVSLDGTNNYQYDATGQLITASQTSESYGYDANGNRTNSGYVTGVDNQLLSDGTYNYQFCWGR